MTNDRKEAEALIAAYEELVKRAVSILDGNGPPWGYVGKKEWARLSFDGETAVVRHPKADSYYDSCTIETDEERFPAALLFMSDADLKAWKAKAMAEYEAEQRKKAAKRIAEKEAQERHAYEILRKKYG